MKEKITCFESESVKYTIEGVKNRASSLRQLNSMVMVVCLIRLIDSEVARFRP